MMDLTLLSVFDQVCKTRSVSRAGENLGVAQSSISIALARLRRLLGDPLFVRTSNGMQATPPLSMLPSVASYGDKAIQLAVGWHLGQPPRPSADEYMNTLARRTGWIRQWNMLMQRFPLVLCPTSLQPPFPQGMDTQSKESLDRILKAQAPSFVVPVLGLPSTAVPTGIGASGLPTGVQIIGQRFREDLTLDAAQVIEARAPMATPIDPR